MDLGFDNYWGALWGMEDSDIELVYWNSPNCDLGLGEQVDQICDKVVEGGNYA